MNHRKCEWCCNHGKCLMFSEEDRRVNCEDIEADFCPNKAKSERS